jgi:hypothetical protein
MAINPMYFQVLSPQQANPLGFGLQQGAQTAADMMQTRGQNIQNQLLSAQLPYAGQIAQADLGLKQAQVPYLQSQTALNMGTIPFLGMKFAAPMMMAQARMMQAGIQNANAFRDWTQTPQGASIVANNPDMANTIAQAMQNSAGLINGGHPSPSPGNFQNPASYPVLPGTMPAQSGTPINAQQINQLRQLAQPGVPNLTSAIQDASGLLSQKKTTDASARQKNLYASNIEKTLNMIDPDSLTQYAGGFGAAQKYANMGAASLNMESKNYDNYVKSLNAANLLATQVRQFYGDSIQPSMIQRLEQLTSPSNWANNPTLAKSQFNQTKQILGQEMGTYRQAMKSTAPYETQNAQYNSNISSAMLTPENLAHTAKKYGMTVEQVKQRLGVS